MDVIIYTDWKLIHVSKRDPRRDVIIKAAVMTHVGTAK